MELLELFLAIADDLIGSLFLFIIFRTAGSIVGHRDIIVRVDDLHLRLGLRSFTLLIGDEILDFVCEFLKHAFREHLIVNQN